MMTNFLKVLFLFTILTSVFSCGSDDDVVEPGSSSDNPFVGTWLMTAVEINAQTNASTFGTEIISEFVTTSSNSTYTVVFTDDAYTISGGFDLNTNTDITIAGMVTSTSQTNSLTDISGDGTYTYDDTTITTSGSLVNISTDGTPGTTTSNTEPVPYTINADGDLVFTNNDTTTESVAGVSTTTVSNSVSRWTKQ